MAMVKATLASGARRSKTASRPSPRATRAASASVMRVQIDMRPGSAVAAHGAAELGACLGLRLHAPLGFRFRSSLPSGSMAAARAACNGGSPRGQWAP